VIIDVVIPTVTGREESLERCIEAYKTRTDSLVRLTIIKDRPTCGIAWNDGAELAGGQYKRLGDFLHFSADDLEPLEGWDVAALSAVYHGYQPSPKLLNPDGSIVYYGRLAVEPPDGTPVEFSTIPFMPWGLWPQVGPSLTAHYYTDNWLSFTADRAGFPSAYFSGYAFIHHHEMVRRGAGMTQESRMTLDKAVFDEAVRSFEP
jgi:hypothetical protein